MALRCYRLPTNHRRWHDAGRSAQDRTSYTLRLYPSDKENKNWLDFSLSQYKQCRQQNTKVFQRAIDGKLPYSNHPFSIQDTRQSVVHHPNLN